MPGRPGETKDILSRDPEVFHPRAFCRDSSVHGLPEGQAGKEQRREKEVEASMEATTNAMWVSAQTATCIRTSCFVIVSENQHLGNFIFFILQRRLRKKT